MPGYDAFGGIQIAADSSPYAVQSPSRYLMPTHPQTRASMASSKRFSDVDGWLSRSSLAGSGTSILLIVRETWSMIFRQFLTIRRRRSAGVLSGQYSLARPILYL